MPDELMTDAAEEADGVTRRAFVAMAVTLAGAAYAGAIGYPVYRYLSTPARRAATATAVTSVELPGAEKLPAGSAMMFKFGTRPAMLIHHADGSWTSCTAVCTHLGCTVQYEAEKDRIHCACHGGVYDPKTGKNVSGPPPKPLQQYNVEVKDVQVIVTRA
jgi:cytochrome b6-f complex iron-sulfur subunit